MVKNKIDISIIIVHYNVKKELLECLSSIYGSNPKASFEIIVVDNDEEKNIKKYLISKFPKVKYVENRNNGWGGGTNKGIELSRGKYIYLLNPDTILLNNALDASYKFAEENERVGVVSSLLFDKNKNVYDLQGTRLLNPLNAVFSLSFINKFFPNNTVSKIFWMKGWTKTKVKKVESATLSAALIKKSVLVEAGGFDEELFMYYEEYDLAKRLKKLGYENFIIPSSKVIHLWEVSAKKTGKANIYIEKSRKYYFKKYYGNIIANIVDFFLGLDVKKALSLFIVSLILLIASFLRIYEIFKTPFIGDQAWFYISARDAVLNGELPLLGITSSHTWIHQGPLWTYLLVPGLLISNFNPVSGIFLSAVFGVASVFMAYVVGRKYVDSNFGMVFSLLLAVSPLVVFHSRFAYHTTPIPFFVLLLFYFFNKWLSGKLTFFPLILLTMSVLYNLELATVIFWPVILICVAYGFLKKKKFVLGLKSKKIIAWSIIGLLLPMLPVLIHDFQNGFPQTIVFAGWFLYKGLQFSGFIEKSSIDSSSFYLAYNFFIQKYESLLLPVKNGGLLLLISSTGLGLFYLVKKKSIWPVFSFTVLGLVAYFISGVPSEAYLVMLFPGLVFLFALAIYSLKSKVLIVFVTAFIALFNIGFLFNNEFLAKETVTLDKKIEVSKKIVEVSNENVKILYSGPGQQFESSVMPYEYLSWWIAQTHGGYKGDNASVVVTEYKKSVNIKPGK